MRRLSWLLLVLDLGCATAPSQRVIAETIRATAPWVREPAPAIERSNDDAFARGFSRGALIAAAVSRDPGLAARAHRVRAFLHGARAERSLPSPEASASVWNLPLERPYSLREAQMYMLEVRQTLPAHGLLGARSLAAALDAQAMLGELAAREREIVHRAARAHAEYVRGTLDHRVHAEQLRLLDEMLEAETARLAAGGATLGDIARVQTEQARLRRAVVRVDGRLAVARAELNALLQRAPDAELGAPEDLAPVSVHIGLVDLLARSRAARGDVTSARARVAASHARTAAAQADAHWPSFMLAVNYWQTPDMRPGIGTSVGMTLPWIWNGPRDRVAQAEEDESAAGYAMSEAESLAQSEISTAYARVASLEREWQSLEADAEPAAQRAVDAVRANYAAGRASALEWLDAARSVLDVRMDENEAVANLGAAIADLEQSVGESLAAVPLESHHEAAR